MPRRTDGATGHLVPHTRNKSIPKTRKKGTRSSVEDIHAKETWLPQATSTFAVCTNYWQLATYWVLSTHVTDRYVWGRTGDKLEHKMFRASK